MAKMTAVNYTRSWLPEMLDELVERWKPSFAWEDYAPLCDRLTDIRTRLRQDHGVKNPRMFCRQCNEIREMTLAPVTIRSLIQAYQFRDFAASEARALQEAEAKTLQERFARARPA